MAGSNQSANTEVIERWLDEAGTAVTDYNFYQLVELLNKLITESTSTQEKEKADELIRFTSVSYTHLL